MDLRVARVGKGRAFFIGAPRRAGVAVHSVGGKEEDIAVAAGRQHDGIGFVAGQLAGDEVAGDDAARLAVDHNDIDHLGAGVHRDAAFLDLLGERAVGADQ